MEKEVLIHVKGLHMMDTPEGDEPIEIVVPGEYYFRNGSHYLRYEEMLDEQGNPLTETKEITLVFNLVTLIKYKNKRSCYKTNGVLSWQ